MAWSYPGNREGVKHPYCDCKCTYECLRSTNPICVYITLADICEGRRQKRTDEDSGKQYFKSVSRYDIKNALLEKDLPLSDNTHGPFGMIPTELLHTSGSGLIMYMFESLSTQLGGRKDRDYIDQ
jgi:hypothetical protein